MNIDEIFLTIDKDPISAASLGQVHKGVLKNKEIVAVNSRIKNSTVVTEAPTRQIRSI